MPGGNPSTQDEAARLSARHYDEVPYHSFPNALLQPSRLGAVATLCGHDAVDPGRARVLEIGCATGGHLIPIAARYPAAQFVGIDVSGVQIEQGRSRIAALGLDNIRLDTLSIADITEPDASFDYIICHGVFSWVPTGIREAILQQCRRLLTPQGLAVISFNVLPGWRMLQVFRDSAILHCRQFATPGEKARNMRALFDALSKYTSEQTSYGKIWRKELGLLTANPDFYLLHELLEDSNTPMTFSAFNGEITAHGLQYLADANLLAGIPENAGDDRGSLIRALAGDDRLSIEQYTDIVLGRTFRSAIVVRAEIPQRPEPAPHLPRLSGMHLVVPMNLEVKELGDGRCSLVDGKAGEIDINGPHAAAVVRKMIARRPSTCSYAELVEASGEAEARRQAADCLHRLVAMGVIDASLDGLDCGGWPSTHPRAWPVALADARAGDGYTVSQRHESVQLNERSRYLLRGCDGTRPVAAFETALLDTILSGGATIAENGQPIRDPERLRVIVRDAVVGELADFARRGLLLP